MSEVPLRVDLAGLLSISNIEICPPLRAFIVLHTRPCMPTFRTNRYRFPCRSYAEIAKFIVAQRGVAAELTRLRVHGVVFWV